MKIDSIEVWPNTAVVMKVIHKSGDVVVKSEYISFLVGDNLVLGLEELKEPIIHTISMYGDVAQRTEQGRSRA